MVKEARVLADAGYDVEVLTSILDPANRHQEVSRVGRGWSANFLIDNSSQAFTDRFRWTYLRTRRIVANKLYRATGLSSQCLFGYCAPELTRACLRSDADLCILHLESAMFAGLALIKRGRRVALDFEDWYSEDLPEEARRYRPFGLLRECEQELARESVYTMATSASMSTAIADAFDAPKPRVVLNTFPLDQQQAIDGKYVDRYDRSRLSICWFSQTIGPGRGLELLMEATHHLKSKIEIHLRGNCAADYERRLRDGAAPHVRPHVFIHPTVPHDDLLSRIAEHDIGFAGEVPTCLSRDLTITNKLFQYLQASVPVVATWTHGQKEACQLAPDAIRLVARNHPVQLAKTIDQWNNPDTLEQAAAAAGRASTTVFHWDRSKEVILAAVSDAIGPANACEHNAHET